MKRDMELIRRILLAAEAQPMDTPLPEVEGVSTEDFFFHVGLLIDAGYVTGTGAGSNELGMGRVDRVTWRGYELLDELRAADMGKDSK